MPLRRNGTAVAAKLAPRAKMVIYIASLYLNVPYHLEILYTFRGRMGGYVRGLQCRTEIHRY
jgi:hypothetical protein